MRNIMSLAKFQLKLLLRNKGFLVFLILIPVLSVFLLNIKYSMLSETEVSECKVSEISDPMIQLTYTADYDKMAIKVLDCSDSELSDHLLNSLSQYGLFQIYRYKAADVTDEEISQINQAASEHDRIGCVIYLSPNFEDEILHGSVQSGLIYYNTSDDERLAALEPALTLQLNRMARYAQSSGSKSGLLTLLNQVSDTIPSHKTITLNSGSDADLTKTQEEYVMRFRFSLAVISLSFIFCGIMISSSIIKEKDNNVLTRILMSRASMSQYLISKLIVTILCNIIQTFFIGMSLKFFIHLDAYINIWSCLFMIFGLGLIFSSMTLCAGILCSNTMAANYLCFTIWSLSCLLGGLYFPLDDAGAWFKAISKLMPQYWTSKCTELMISGNNSSYPLYLLIIGAYIIVFGTIALLGTHLSKNETVST